MKGGSVKKFSQREYKRANRLNRRTRTVDDVQHHRGGVQVGGHAGVVAALLLPHLQDGERGRDGLHVRAFHLHLWKESTITC